MYIGLIGFGVDLFSLYWFASYFVWVFRLLFVLGVGILDLIWMFSLQ